MDSTQGTVPRPATQVTDTAASRAASSRRRDEATSQLSESLKRISPGLQVEGSNFPTPERGRLRSEISGLAWSVRNAGRGRALAASGNQALADVSGLLIRMRSLAIQASNGTLGSEERSGLNTRFQSLNDQISEVVQVSEINRRSPFDGGRYDIGNFSTVSLGTVELEPIELNGSVTNLGGSGVGAVSISTVTGAQRSVAFVDSAISRARSFVNAFEVFEDRLDAAIQRGRSAIAERIPSETAIQDVDEAAERAELTRDAALNEPQAATRAHFKISPEAAMALLR